MVDRYYGSNDSMNACTSGIFQLRFGFDIDKAQRDNGENDSVNACTVRYRK